MSRDELLVKYDEIISLWMDKEAKLESFIQKWLNGETQISNETMQQLVDKTTEQIEQLKAQSEQLLIEYKRVVQEEEMRKYAIIAVRHNFNTSPEEVIITGGVLSSNANESHLEGRHKTNEELELEKQQLLAQVREKVMDKQISLAQASQMSQQINTAYGTNQNFDQEIVHSSRI